VLPPIDSFAYRVFALEFVGRAESATRVSRGAIEFVRSVVAVAMTITVEFFINAVSTRALELSIKALAEHCSKEDQ
jgi:hypothetical protein